MQFIDLKDQYHRIQENLNRRIHKVFEHGQFIMGSEIKELEERLARYTDVKHCIALSSGTDALLIALMALEIGPGDEVITTPFSFVATASMIKMVGATPVFVDIDPRTYNIDPNAINSVITEKTKAILPVNLYGQCAEYDAINAIAKKYNLYVIEDAAQSFGAKYKGRKSGNLGTISCTSFYPSKPLGCYGDGGACFTNDDELAIRMRHIRNHGQDRSYHHVRLGLNGRLDTLQAAILLAKLDIFDSELEQRRILAKHYDALLVDKVLIPFVETHNESVYAQYTIQVNDRDQIAKRLAEDNIPTAVHYPLPIHQQPLFSNFENKIHFSFPHAENSSKRVLSLPFHPYLKNEDIYRIVEVMMSKVSNTMFSESLL